MNQIYCIIGKSGAGKDTIYKEIVSRTWEGLIPVVPYTTRPMRKGETDGVDYHFVSEEELARYLAAGEVVELRQYDTMQGIWSYFTRRFRLEGTNDYILITTPEGAGKLVEQYGAESVQVVCLYLDDRERLLRCIGREARQTRPDYAEVCRRFLADQEDFSEEKLRQFAHIHYINTAQEPEACLRRWTDIYQAEGAGGAPAEAVAARK